MNFFIFLIFILVILILVTLSNTIIYIALRIITKAKYNQRKLILPSLISIIFMFLIIYIFLKTVIRIYNIDLLDYVIKVVFLVPVASIDLKEILLILIGFLIVGILLQSFTLLLVNIDYTKLAFKLRKGFVKIINRVARKEVLKIKENNNDLAIETVEKEKKLKYVNSLIASLFIFSLIFFLIIAMYYTGIMISKKLNF